MDIENWKFLVGDILVPIATLVLGFFIGRTTEKRKAKAIINNKCTVPEGNAESD